MDQGTEEKVTQHQRPFGCGVHRVWFPRPSRNSLQQLPLVDDAALPLLPRGNAVGLLLKVTWSSCSWQFLDVVGVPGIGMRFSLHGAPGEIRVVEEPRSELPAATSAELTHLEHTPGLVSEAPQSGKTS